MADVQACRCGAGQHATNASRCENGHVLPGNENARKHGAWSYQRGRGDDALPPAVRDTVEVFRQQVIADRGGEDNLTAIESGYIRRLGELEAVARLLAADLATKGLTTARGRVRGLYSRWLETLDRWDRFAQRVGAERKARPVSPFESVKAAVEEANRR
jgi:hypothetical protein